MGGILGLVLKRLGFGLITLLIISIIIFFMVELLPTSMSSKSKPTGCPVATEVRLTRKHGEIFAAGSCASRLE